MSEENFTKLPSRKRKKKRKAHTKTTLNKAIEEVAREERRHKTSKQRAKTSEAKTLAQNKKAAANAKKKKLQSVKKTLETESGIVTTDMLEDDDIPVAARTDLQNAKVLFKPLVNPVTGRSPQTEFLEAGEDEVLLSGGRGPLVYGEKVLTQYGWRTIEEVKVGDWVRCPDNSLSQIIAEPFDGYDDCYEIEFIDGRKVKVGAYHIWELNIVGRTLKEGSRLNILRTTQWMYEHWKKNIEGQVGEKDTLRHILIPLTEPVRLKQMGTVRHEVDPYLLGLLLGDGCITKNALTLTTVDEEIVRWCADLHKEGVTYRNNKTVTFKQPKRLREELKKFKLFGTNSLTKFIPKKYKEADPEVRLALLQGLMDTDGTAEINGTASYCSISKQLAEDVQYLVRSLGGKATISTKDPFYYDSEGKRVSGKLSYIIYIQMGDNSKLFRLPRKKERASTQFNGGISEPKLRVKSITPIGRFKCKCITIDDPRGLFLTNDFIVTHNSGKSHALIAALLRPEWISNRNYKVLVIRRTMRELQDLISKAKIMCKDAVPGSKWKAQDKTIYFPSGASIEFGYCETKDDVERYRGREFCILAMDELTMIPDEDMYIALISSVRTVDPDLPTQVIATTNPYGVGFLWVKRRFIDKGPEGETITISHTNEMTGKKYYTTRKWITSSWEDNPLIKDSYVASLASLPPEKRKRWLEGSWDGGDGMAFPDFKREVHVIEPFSIPHSWPRFRACDWGYTTRAITLWFAVDYENCLYIYREYGDTMCTADRYARNVLDMEAGEKIQYGVIDGSVGDKRGNPAPSIDEIMRKEGCIWRYADKSQNSREAGKNLMHQYLAVDPDLNKPRIQIFNTCTETIESLSTLPSDPKKPDDVDTKHPNDHAWDACRFGILSRPKFKQSWDKPEYRQPPPVINSTFGY